MIDATKLMRAVQSFLRLTAGADFDEDAAPVELKDSLARAAECPDFAALKDSLIATAQSVLELYEAMIEEPAQAVRERLEAQDKGAETTT